MKKLLFSTALLLSFCCLSAQTNNSKKENQSATEDVLFLQKSNVLLKIQLKEQKHTLIKQIQRTDSIISILQSVRNEIKEGAANQNSINQSIATLQNQTTGIFHSLNKRKHYAIITFIGSIIIVLIYLFYLNAKLVAINKNIKQNEENLNKQLSDTKDFINSIKNDFNTNISEINESIKNIHLKKS